MKVDLPAPFGPVSPYRRPAEKVVVTSSKRTFDPNRIDMPWTEIIENPERWSVEAAGDGHVGQKCATRTIYCSAKPCRIRHAGDILAPHRLQDGILHDVILYNFGGRA